jgi:preprotein translocase subunit SecE
VARDLWSRAAIVLARPISIERDQRRIGTNMVNPFQFLQEVRAEGSKVTWPSRRETLITTSLVLAMVLVASLFFVSVDQMLLLIVRTALSFGR